METSETHEEVTPTAESTGASNLQGSLDSQVDEHSDSSNGTKEPDNQENGGEEHATKKEDHNEGGKERVDGADNEKNGGGSDSGKKDADDVCQTDESGRKEHDSKAEENVSDMRDDGGDVGDVNG